MTRVLNNKSMNLTSMQEYQYLLYKNYYKDVFRTIYYITNDIEFAKELTNETFAQAFEKLDALKEQDKFKQWITVIARNITFNYLKRNSKYILVEDIELLNMELDIYSVEGIVEAREMRNEVNIILEQLELRFKEVLILRYYHDFSYEEIQGKLDINMNTIKSRLHRAKKKVYDMLRLAGEIND